MSKQFPKRLTIKVLKDFQKKNAEKLLQGWEFSKKIIGNYQRKFCRNNQNSSRRNLHLTYWSEFQFWSNWERNLRSNWLEDSHMNYKKSSQNILKVLALKMFTLLLGFSLQKINEWIKESKRKPWRNYVEETLKVWSKFWFKTLKRVSQLTDGTLRKKTSW